MRCKSLGYFFLINIKIFFLTPSSVQDYFVHVVERHSLDNNFSSTSKKNKEQNIFILWSEYL